MLDTNNDVSKSNTIAEAKIPPTFIKMIAGHKGAMSMTEKVYTHIDMQYLIDTVNSIYYPENIKEKFNRPKN